MVLVIDVYWLDFFLAVLGLEDHVLGVRERAECCCAMNFARAGTFVGGGWRNAAGTSGW